MISNQPQRYGFATCAPYKTSTPVDAQIGSACCVVSSTPRHVLLQAVRQRRLTKLKTWSRTFCAAATLSGFSASSGSVQSMFFNSAQAHSWRGGALRPCIPHPGQGELRARQLTCVMPMMPPCCGLNSRRYKSTVWAWHSRSVFAILPRQQCCERDALRGKHDSLGPCRRVVPSVLHVCQAAEARKDVGLRVSA